MTIISATSAIDRTILVLFWLSAVLVINLPSHGRGIGYRLDMSKVGPPLNRRAFIVQCSKGMKSSIQSPNNCSVSNKAGFIRS